MEERFKKGDIVYIARKDDTGKYHSEKCEVIGMLDKLAFENNIYILSVKNDITYRIKSIIFETLRSARMHCDILNYGERYENGA